ncbi:hypothetical protein DPMN_085820 [Dreissena polymorpha]|uniref:Uncharacterized protein n=1 Tax=Dreissena polymorpha TaxID=45954 RepID=A0A9D4BD67_DREPO|nr:hypothetical protein DPMN_085820 [Dreissena polymorpha]
MPSPTPRAGSSCTEQTRASASSDHGYCFRLHSRVAPISVFGMSRISPWRESSPGTSASTAAFRCSCRVSPFRTHL